MKKRNTKLSPDLYTEAMEIMRKSDIILQMAIWHEKEIRKYMKKYPDDKIEELGWEEREKALKLGEELYARLGKVEEEMVKLDAEYQVLKEKVKKKYGRDVMPPIQGLTSSKLKDREIELR